MLYNLSAVVPTTSDKAQVNMKESDQMAGFPGAIGAAGAAHNMMLDKVQNRFRQAPHHGFKITQTAQTYNININHRQHILSTTQGHPAWWNDRPLVLFDNFMQTRLHEGKILVSKDIVMQPWLRLLMVDIALAHPATTVPPIKTSTTVSQRSNSLHGLSHSVARMLSVRLEF